MSFKEVCKWVESQGWTFMRVNGSHYLYSHANGTRPVAICHKSRNKTFGKNLIKKIQKDMNNSIRSKVA